MSDLRLDIQTVNSNLITRNKPDEIQISGNQADLIIDKKESTFTIMQKPDTIEINNYPAWSQLDNSKNTRDMTNKIGGYSRSKAMKATAEYSADGDRMMAIENKNSNPIVEISKRKSETFSKVEINEDYFPKNAIKVNVKKGYIKYNFDPAEIKTDVRKNLQIDVKKGRLTTNIDRYPEVIINVVGENTDRIG